MLLSTGHHRCFFAAKEHPFEAVAHLSLLIAPIDGIVNTELTREVLPEAHHTPIGEKNTPAQYGAPVKCNGACVYISRS